MAHFTGMVVRRYLKKDGSSNSDYAANLENSVRNIAFDENCDEVTYYSGGGPVDGSTSNNTSPSTGDGGTSGWSANCVEYYEDLIIDRICPKYIGEKSQCINYFISVLVTNCGEPPNHTEVNDNNTCPSPGSEEIGVIIEDEEFRMIAFKYHLENDPTALIEINCDQILKWQELVQHKPPQSVIDKIETLDTQNPILFDEDWDIQYIRDAYGPVVNLDYFPVRIAQLPIDPNSGNRFSPDQFLEYVRKNLNLFFDGNPTEFGAYNSLC